ncbi:MAG TPA: endolytic transglycosylase MltG, partial [Miltoncostaeaceae bacterium]|nr:endolytic transglycosylase MltG [Miltoncostaeaceae bacterium]
PRDRTAARRPSHAHGGRTLLWLVLILAVGGLLAIAAVRSLGGGDAEQAPEVAATTTATPTGRITFPEGLRREEMADIVARELGVPRERYLQLTAPGARGRQLARADAPRSLEGFLFPATYDVFPGTTAQDVVDQQVQAYRDRTDGIDYSYARSRNLTRYDVLILASMIEREVRVPAERPIVAAVMYNRLRAGMRLDIDATVQYALGEWKPELTASDLQTDSPYNTRRYGGLPPGPICNPGSASIAAAARPARVDYLYYVARADGTGRHYFARTAAEHAAAIARARANAGG